METRRGLREEKGTPSLKAVFWEYGRWTHVPFLDAGLTKFGASVGGRARVFGPATSKEEDVQR